MPHNPDKLYELRYLSRIEIAGRKGKGATYGWQFRFKRKDITITRFFGDSKFGGKEKALTAAQEFRDEIEKFYPSPITQEKGYTTRRSQRNTSGFVGISRTEHKYTKKDRPGQYVRSAWVASWTDASGKRIKRAFSIPKYGETEALRLAISARRKAIEALTGRADSANEWGKHPYGQIIEIVETSKDSNEKGKALEELIVRLFTDTPSFIVNSIRTETETEEIDVMVLNNSDDPRFKRESAILLVECKNWSGKCGKNEFVIFKEKIENRKSRCSLGFFVSWNGFAETVTKEMLRGSKEQTLVIPLSGAEIKKAVQENNFENVLAAAWDKAITL